MWSINEGGPAIHDDAVFVRAVDVLRTQHSLPAGSDAARGREDVVVAVTFVELWSFDRRMVNAAVEHHLPLVEQFGSVGTHAVNREDAFYAGPAVGPCMDQVRIAVVVPERRRIDPTVR